MPDQFWTAHDVEVNLLDSYVSITDGDRKIPFFVKGADGTEEDEDYPFAVGFSIDIETNSYHNKTISVHSEELNLEVPMTGAINIDGLKSVALIVRKPIKSYRKGIRQADIDIIDPVKLENRLLKRKNNLSFNNKELVYNIFNRSYPSAQDALLQMVNLERLGVAFSPDYYFTLSYFMNRIILWKHLHPIGYIRNLNTKRLVLAKEAELFVEELNSFGLNPVIEQ